MHGLVMSAGVGRGIWTYHRDDVLLDSVGERNKLEVEGEIELLSKYGQFLGCNEGTGALRTELRSSAREMVCCARDMVGCRRKSP
jgi:hypothetical protein